jgi:Zn-dependent protease
MIDIFYIIILILSIIIHEYMHGWMADRLGDNTARAAGRLTMNPIPHIDLFGSIILPGLLILSGGGFVIGWAKPVPFNPYNLRDRRYGAAKVAAAGPLANIAIALVMGLILRFLPVSYDFSGLISLIVLVNIVLAIFNLVPIPPLDGSKILAALLPAKFRHKYEGLERYGMMIVIAFAFFGFQLISPAISWLFALFTGSYLY